MADKKQNVKFITPAGVGRFLWFNKPDTKFNPEGDFKGSIVLDGAEEAVQALIEQIDEMVDAQYEETAAELKPPKRKTLGKNYPYEAEIDEDTEEETGRFIFKASTKASGTFKNGPKAGQKWNKKLPMFDAANKPTTANVFGGSTIKMACSASPYYMPSTNAVGVKLYLDAVQVIELAARDSDGGSFGFGEQDGGFVDSGADTPFGRGESSDSEDGDDASNEAAEY